jgi:arginase
MPLSAALADDNLSCQNNEVPAETQVHWEQMKI